MAVTSRSNHERADHAGLDCRLIFRGYFTPNVIGGEGWQLAGNLQYCRIDCRADFGLCAAFHCLDCIVAGRRCLLRIKE
ncbi:MAG: hypothetical protein ACYC4U_02365 [Pirellulaceae bacterium]